MKPAICIEMLYPGMLPEEKIRRVAGHGFGSVEFWGSADKDIGAIAAAAAETGVRIVNFSANRSGDLIDAATHGSLLREIGESLETARRLGCGTLMVLSNELGEGGRVLHPCAGLRADLKRANLVAGLRRVLELVPEDFTIVLEPLNTVLDHPGNFLEGSKAAAEIVGEIGDARLGILCDFYHLALMGEYPPETARRYLSSIRHVHIADYPGRHEPGTGRGPWRETLRALREGGYAGYVGFEFAPSGEGDAALEAVARTWREALGAEALP